MPVQAEVEGAEAEGAGPAREWLQCGSLDTVHELNEMGLGLLAEQGVARGRAACPLLREVAELWRMLDAPARHRAADCPYLLLDAGFADPARWRAGAQEEVGDSAAIAYGAFFTVEGAAQMAQLVFTCAWHLARSEPADARLLLGMLPASAALISAFTLRQIQALAERRLAWLRPRWPARIEVWRDLLIAAASGEGRALERARLRGLTHLAAETWHASLSGGRADRADQSPGR